MNKKEFRRLIELTQIHEMEENNKEEFVPPKPKEFDMAALIIISFEAVRGMKSLLKTGSGSVRLSVNGAIPCHDISTREKEHKYEFTITKGPHSVPKKIFPVDQT